MTREAERFQFELPVRKKSRCLRFQEFVLLGFFFKAKTFEGLFLEIFFTKQESVSEQILPAAERKCWRSAAVGEGNSSQKLNRVCQLHLLRS